MNQLPFFQYLTGAKLVAGSVFLLILMGNAHAQKGEKLFKENCSSCHKLSQKVVGPPLGNWNVRRPYGELHAFVRNSDSSVIRKDPYYKKLKKQYRNTAYVHKFPFNEKEVDALYAYMSGDSSTTPVTSGNPNVLPKIHLVFNVDSLMYTGDDYKAKLDLSTSKQLIQEKINELIKRNNPTIINEDSLTNRPKYIDAVLKSPFFEIAEMGEIGFRDAKVNSNLDWVWSIKPLKESQNAVLYLTIYFSDKADADISKSQTLDRKEYIIKTISRKATAMEKISGFIGNNWQWLITIIVIPLITFAYNQWRQKKKKEEN